MVEEAAAGAGGRSAGDFAEVLLDRDCPQCGKRGLPRERDANPGARLPSVMPIYVCGGCGKRGYHLTDQYLESLIAERPELFSEDELRQRDADRTAFTEEIKAYIIRIFASQRIVCIE